jgi:hypothetical protein
LESNLDLSQTASYNGESVSNIRNRFWIWGLRIGKTLMKFLSDKFSEQRTAEEVVLFLNEYLSRMTDVIFKFNGTIDKFIGDAIMTVFGAPFKNEDDALRAVKTAVEMIRELTKLNLIAFKPDSFL